MKIYRYEMPDGGGPYFTLNGIQRKTKENFHLSFDYVFGCESEEDLKNYFKGKEEDIKECEIIVRDIPDNLIIKTKKQIIFPKFLINGQTKLNK